MSTYDLLVVGGGVQGLWIARHALQAGLSVALVEAEHCGAGASGGLLGALMPHVATGWSEKKQFQFSALVSLKEEALRLQDETGIDPGYGRCGRIMPVRAKGFLDQFESRRIATWQHWRASSQRFELSLLDTDAHSAWLAPEAAGLGVFWDPLAARIDPRRYIAALRASIAGQCDVFEGHRFTGFDARSAKVDCAPELDIQAGAVVLAAGYESFGLSEQITGLNLGRGVKGQAVALAAQMPAERPIIYDDGMYIVAHTPTLCAVGSTTEADWRDPRAVDDGIAEKLERARQLCPPLRDAEVVASWAGVRPQSAARDPIAGRLHETAPIYIASGGFKITLGIAHLVAERLVDGIVHGRQPIGLPASFAPDLHIAAAQSKRDRIMAGEIA